METCFSVTYRSHVLRFYLRGVCVAKDKGTRSLYNLNIWIDMCSNLSMHFSWNVTKIRL